MAIACVAPGCVLPAIENRSQLTAQIAQAILGGLSLETGVTVYGHHRYCRVALALIARHYSRITIAARGNAQLLRAAWEANLRKAIHIDADARLPRRTRPMPCISLSVPTSIGLLSGTRQTVRDAHGAGCGGDAQAPTVMIGIGIDFIWLEKPHENVFIYRRVSAHDSAIPRHAGNNGAQIWVMASRTRQVISRMCNERK